MKTIKYIAILAIAATIAACETQGGDNIENARTKPGAVVYERASDAISENVAVATLAQKVDEYLNVATERERDSIKTLHLSQYAIEIDGPLVKLSSRVIWTFDTKNLSLQETDAEWSVEARQSGYHPSEARVVIPTDGCKIRRVNETTLKLTIKVQKTSQFTTSANLTVAYTDAATNNLSTYHAVGSGIMSTLEGSLLVDYNIGAPLKSERLTQDRTQAMAMSYPQYIKSPFINGAINMEVVQASGSHNVVADLRKSSLARVIVTISMGGVSEDWVARY